MGAARLAILWQENQAGRKQIMGIAGRRSRTLHSQAVGSTPTISTIYVGTVPLAAAESKCFLMNSDLLKPERLAADSICRASTVFSCQKISVDEAKFYAM